MTQSLTPQDKNANKKETHTSMERDYCLFMDGSKYNRNIACRMHDNAYGIYGGGSEKDRAEADKKLFKHMKAHKDPLAYFAYMIVRLYGWFFFNYQKSMLWKGQLIKKILTVGKKESS